MKINYKPNIQKNLKRIKNDNARDLIFRLRREISVNTIHYRNKNPKMVELKKIKLYIIMNYTQ